jgi:hypothetical protein
MLYSLREHEAFVGRWLFLFRALFEMNNIEDFCQLSSHTSHDNAFNVVGRVFLLRYQRWLAMRSLVSLKRDVGDGYTRRRCVGWQR